jgi:hypothetical protein
MKGKQSTQNDQSAQEEKGNKILQGKDGSMTKPCQKNLDKNIKNQNMNLQQL